MTIGCSSGKLRDPCHPGGGQLHFSHMFSSAFENMREKWEGDGGSVEISTLVPRRATRCSPVSMEFREVFKDSFIRGIKVILWALISSSTLISKYHLAHSALSALFISKKLILLFFFFFFSLLPGQIGVLYSTCFARSPQHLLECEKFEGMDKRHFSNQHFFFFFTLSTFFLFKSCFSLFIREGEGASELVSFTSPDMRPVELCRID